jgi:hypothetical protein
LASLRPLSQSDGPKKKKKRKKRVGKALDCSSVIHHGLFKKKSFKFGFDTFGGSTNGHLEPRTGLTEANTATINITADIVYDIH